jgi:TolB-like protein
MKKLFTVFAVSIIWLSLKATPAKQPTIAVMPFQVNNFTQQLNINGRIVTRQLLEREFSNQLINFLVKSRKFNVVNRTDIQKILDESKLTESEWAKPGQEKHIGQLLMADYLVTGAINRLEFVNRRKFIKLTGETTNDINATFKFQFKITSIKSGKIVVAEQVTEKITSRDVRKEVSASERKNWTLSDYKDFLFNRAVNKAGNAILAGVYPVKIASANGRIVMLNRGLGAGILKGQIYEVFNQGEMVTDPDTGEVLGSNEEKVGSIRIIAVNARFSKGEIIKGEGRVLKGAICRKTEKSTAQTTAPAYPRVTPGW